jgi:hypothetical protein
MKKILFGILFLLTALLTVVFVIAQTCDTQSGSVVGYTGGDGDTISELQGIKNDEVGLELRLKYKGANFSPTGNYDITTNQRMTGAAADLNGDGFVDLIEGGRKCDDHIDPDLGNSNPLDTNLSIFVSQGKDPVDETRFSFKGPYDILYSQINYRTYEIIALGAGDYDGDGDADITAMSWAGNLYIFWNKYEELSLSPGDDPEFDETPILIMNVINDGYGEFAQDSKHWRWESNIASVDIDGDHDLDLIVGVPTKWGEYGQVVILINNGSGDFSRLDTAIVPYPNPSMIYGVCGVAAGDFDGDGDVDFIVGSASSKILYIYRNTGTTAFTQYSWNMEVPAKKGSATLLREGDFDGDGDIDFVLATDGHITNKPGGYVFWFDNIWNKNEAEKFIINCIPDDGSQITTGFDLDSGAAGDFDNDGDIDFFIADGNDSENCYFVMNELSPYYVDRGEVGSKNLLPCSFITSDNAIVSATISVSDNTPPGTLITYYLANSNDENGNPKWEGPVSPGEEFFFESPGLFLRWKAVFETDDEYETPKIFWLNISYKYITKREYSRSSHAFTLADVDSEETGDEEVLFSASFEFPTWKGHLRSWDVTSLTLANSKNSQLEDILDVGALYVEDAGEMLVGKSYSTRDVFTAYDADGQGIMNDKLDFNDSNADTLDDYLGLGIGSPEVEPLINFVLGYGRDWKLGDINHSSPQVLEPPNENHNQMGSGYDVFKSDHADRPKVILVGANDGMLHCFDPVSLEELWAFIPHNLLYKLKKMKIVDRDCGEYLTHQSFVDGTPTIKDVYFGSAWHTILVSGQGPGWGKDHKWYYFAIDITDPYSPQPLWELTDDTMGETWSVPAIGKVESIGKWVAFFGSGYDTENPAEDIGNYFYAVDVEDGTLIKSFEIPENPDAFSQWGIQNTIPASPALVDKDSDGYVEYIYFGDLTGRLWKIDLTQATDKWSPSVIYQDPYYHPIITKPAGYIDQAESTIHLCFGTGGDDNAPSDAYYSFIACQDSGSSSVDVEWYIGPEDLAGELGISTDLKKDEFGQGEKVWADPVISDRIVYIATSRGFIESLNPCLTLEGSGRIYARYVLGQGVGGSALLGSSGTIAYLETQQKVRSAVTVGETQEIGQENPSTVRKVFIQSYTRPDAGSSEPPSEVLAQPVAGNRLIIKSWREIYKIIKHIPF